MGRYNDRFVIYILERLMIIIAIILLIVLFIHLFTWNRYSLYESERLKDIDDEKQINVDLKEVEREF